MITLKKVDVYGQVILFAAALIWALFTQIEPAWLIGYFVIGGWQLLSVMVHWAWSSHWPLRTDRSLYAWVLILLLLAGLISLIVTPGIFIYLGLPMVAGPLLAVWYFKISFRELSSWQLRTLIRWR